MSEKNEPDDPDLVLKTTPPRLPRGLLVRGRLSLEGELFRDKTLIEVVAPPGFGKTSLLGQWRREALARGHLAAWLTLDERDDSLRLAQGLALAMRIASGRPGFGRALWVSAGTGGGELEKLTGWLAEVANLGAETLLILDDVHLAPQHTAQDALCYLLLNAPPNLRIVFAARKKLHLPLTELKARGLYTTVDPQRLRFTLNETVQLLTNRFGARIEDGDCARLHDKTAGWPLGLQLAITGIEQRTDLAAAISSLQATNEDFERYFLDCLLAGLSAEEVDFLVRISVLDAFCADLARVLLERQTATQTLSRLANEAPIFTVAADSDWMRLHPLARDFLRNRAAKLPERELETLHRRAAAWFEAQGMLEEAARHTLAAGERDAAWRLVSASLSQLLKSGQLQRVLYWLEQVPDEELEQHPRALLSFAWALAQSERAMEAARLANRLTAKSAVGDVERIECALISGLSEYFCDRMDNAASFTAPWRGEKSAQIPSEQLRAIQANFDATVLLYAGRPEQARYCARTAYADWKGGINHTRAWGFWVTGFSYLWEGQARLARDILAEPLAVLEESLGRRSGGAVMLASVMAMSLWECGQVEAASETLAGRLDLFERLSFPEATAMGYQTAGRIALHSGQERRALDLLENLSALGEARRIPRYCITSLTEQARIHALAGREDAAAECLRRLTTYAKRPWHEPLQAAYKILFGLRIGLAESYLALVRHDWPALRKSLPTHKAAAEKLRRGRETVELCLLAVIAAQRQNENADTLLAATRSQIDLYGLANTLLNTHPQLFKSAPTPLLVATTVAPTVSTNPTVKQLQLLQKRAGGLLTSKEEEVLQLLGRNLSNKQVAVALGVSDETVKWHIKNLFGKLSAVSRKHVVDRARMLGLLE